MLFLFPWKQSWLGVVGTRLIPADQQRQANLCKTSLVYIASSVQVSLSPSTPFISLSYLSCSGSVSICRFSFSVWGLSISYNDLHFLCTRGHQKWRFSGLHVKPSKAKALGKAELEQPFCLWFSKWFIAFLMALEAKSHKSYFLRKLFNPCF